MKKLAMITLALWLLLPFGALAEAREVTSTDLIENALALDGQTVTYTGEVVGDIMKRGDHTWLNLSDGSNAMGVWAETAALGQIAVAGRYGEKGDTVEVTGTFHRACREHGGDLDIHADTLTVLTPGSAVEHDVHWGRLIAAGVFVVLDAVILARVWMKRRRLGKG